MIAIQEHYKIEPELLQGFDLEELRQRVNYRPSRFDSSMVNLIRFEFDPKKNLNGFFSYFRIGAEWLDKEQTRPVIVTPKMKDIDFLEMFMVCLRNNESADNFSAIYDIDFEARPIQSKALSSILSSLLVVQYLMTMSRIVSRGLRKGYVHREENISKVKGRLDIRRSERNVVLGHREQVFCRFEEYLVDTPENRLLKCALMVTSDMVSLMRGHSAYPTLAAMLNNCMIALSEVSYTPAMNVNVIKSNKLYREYNDAIRLANMILRRQDIAINYHRESTHDVVPVFRIDMALLFEHYVLAKLRYSFGHNAIMYQVNGSNPFIADFLIKKGDLRIIADTKYVDPSRVSKGDYIKQLGGYSRDHRFLKLLGYDTTDADSVPVVPCLILYPAEQAPSLNEYSILSYPVGHTLKFFTFPVRIPTYNCLSL